MRYNRWDILLQEWFDKKTDAERKQMQNMRRKRIGDRIISRKEQIKPRYQLENEDIFLCLPNIRLSEITQRPILKVFQNGNLLTEHRLSVYGNEMCYTIRECTMKSRKVLFLARFLRLSFRCKIRKSFTDTFLLSR